MKIDAVKSHEFPPVVQAYTRKDAILYALGLGYGEDAQSEAHLQFLLEERLKAVPSMGVVLGHSGFWAREPKFEIDWVKLLHAEQSLELLQPLKPEGKIVARNSIVGVSDKGAGKGALVYQRRELFDAESNELVARLVTTLFLRGDGGCGSFGEQIAPPTELPARAPDRTLSIKTLPQSALIYRLSGDLNPIHADPIIARKAGFEKPILHGLCTMGVACRALIEACAGDDPARVKYISVRFSKPVYPGETLAVDFYSEGENVRFRVRAAERDIVVLDRGLAVLTR